MALWTEFPDELDRSAISIAYDAWKKKKVDKKAAALAVFNILGYATSYYVNEDLSVTPMGSVSDEEAEACFKELLDDQVAFEYGAIGDGKILKKLIPVLLQLLPLLL